MKDFLITVESTRGMDPQPVISERLIGVTEDYAKGVKDGLKLAHPKNEVYLEEIKN